MLQIAALYGNEDVAALLLKKGADVNATSFDNSTPLLAACGETNLTLIRLLLDKGANPNAANKDGMTPLMVTLAAGNLEAVDLLLGKKADVNTKQSNGVTPLVFAAWRGDLEAVRKLLKAKPELEAKAMDGVTALDLARQKGHEAVVEALRAAGARTCTDHRVSKLQKAHEDLLPLAVSGAAARVQDNRGDDTPSMEIMRMFYRGKLLDDWKAQGMSPRQLAAMLLSSVAAIHKGTVTVGMFSDPSEWAKDPRKGFVDKAETESWDAFKQQLLGAAATDSQSANISDAKGNTVLMWAVVNNDLELANWLVAHGADLNAKADDGKTALMMAQQSKRNELAALLRSEAEKVR